ncbi:MAG: DUF4145 domain-containing protein [Anaerolineales bacterium]|nr:DUF4145 domain-containing protein [Anaerolineales bacterium]
MHCLVEFHDKKNETFVGEDTDGGWSIFQYDCPSCKRTNLFLVNGVVSEVPYKTIFDKNINAIIPVRPFGSNRPPCPEEVPFNIASDYKEACLVFPFSPKASAALSRRCLQNLLRDVAKVKPSDLSKEIQEVIDSGKLPSQLADSIDAIRNIGNFAAHPIKGKITGEIVDVEPEEAEWNLDVLESLFDFYYVQPAKVAKKRDALNAKLTQAGKPLMK